MKRLKKLMVTMALSIGMFGLTQLAAPAANAVSGGGGGCHKECDFLNGWWCSAAIWSDTSCIAWSSHCVDGFTCIGGVGYSFQN